MPENIKLVIFDLDGTLVNAYPAIEKSFNFTMRRMGLPKQKSRAICRAVGWGDSNLLKPFVGTKDLNKCLALYRRHHRQALKKGTRFLPGARGILEILKERGYKIAIASNRPTIFSWIIIRHLKMDQYLDYVLCGDKLKKAKPHPDIILQILKKFSLNPGEAVYVGDMTVDVQSGKRAGVRTVAVITGSSTQREMAPLKPYRIIRRISQLRKILGGLG